MDIGNLFNGIPATLPQEMTNDLMQNGAFKLERIVSKGHHSAPGFWYDQPQNEWVLLLKGEAMLRFEEGDRTVHMTEGMYVHIPAHARHRVDWTKENAETVWLALFY